jgi:hypothetical protein
MAHTHWSGLRSSPRSRSMMMRTPCAGRGAAAAAGRRPPGSASLHGGAVTRMVGFRPSGRRPGGAAVRMPCRPWRSRCISAGRRGGLSSAPGPPGFPSPPHPCTCPAALGAARPMLPTQPLLAVSPSHSFDPCPGPGSCSGHAGAPAWPPRPLHAPARGRRGPGAGAGGGRGGGGSRPHRRPAPARLLRQVRGFRVSQTFGVLKP